jgi:hypothetical protein
MRLPGFTFRLSTLLWTALVVAAFCGGMATEKWLLREPTPPVQQLLEPCHPGCFPAGTMIIVPGGSKPIERVRQGDRVTTVGSDGSFSAADVAAVFVTRNRLLEVQTDAGNLVTTRTQPLALVDGGLRGAGELKCGDRIFRSSRGGREAVTVRRVSATRRVEQVFNLILREPAIFVANGFLARSKPPASALASADDTFDAASTGTKE